MEGFWNGLGCALVILAIAQCTKMDRNIPESHKERICKNYSKSTSEYEQCFENAKIP